MWVFTLLVVFGAGILSRDILHWIILCWGGWEVNSRILASTH